MQSGNSSQRWVGIALALLLSFFTTSFSAHAGSASYEYDTQGRITKITYDDGTVVDYAYDANGNRTSAAKTLPPPDTTPPSAPGTPTFSAVTMSTATASWTAATDNRSVLGYDYRLNAGSWQALSNVLSVNLSGLSAGTAYTFAVRARDAATNTGPASSASFTTPDTVAPSVPAGLSVSAPNSSTVNLSWSASTDNAAVTGYQVFRNGSHIGSSSTTSYADSGLTGSTTYSYQVRAYDAAGNVSGLSNAVNATTPDTIAPSTPSNLSASPVSSAQVNLVWSAATDTGGSGLAGYQVFRNGAHIATTAATSYPDTGLSGTTTYSYQVRAYDGASNFSGMSGAANATTPDSIAPSTPVSLSAAAASQTQINLSWAPSSDTGGSGLAGYRVYRNGSHIANSGTTSYADAGLSGSTGYSYQVSAYDVAGNASGLSNVASATTPDTTAPSAPSNLSAAVAGYSKINLSWSGSGDTGGSGLAGYQIYRNGIHIANTGATSYADTGLSGSTAYSYTVTAYDGASNVSGHSNGAGGTTWPPLLATVNDGTWRLLIRPGKPTQTDPPSVATATGGSGGYTYAWQYISGDTQISPVSPGSRTTSWSRTMPYQDAEYQALWRCQITDTASGETAYTAVSVTFIRRTIQ